MPILAAMITLDFQERLQVTFIVVANADGLIVAHNQILTKQLAAHQFPQIAVSHSEEHGRS